MSFLYNVKLTKRGLAFHCMRHLQSMDLKFLRLEHLAFKPQSHGMQELPSGIVGLAMVRNRSFDLVLLPCGNRATTVMFL